MIEQEAIEEAGAYFLTEDNICGCAETTFGPLERQATRNGRHGLGAGRAARAGDVHLYQVDKTSSDGVDDE